MNTNDILPFVCPKFAEYVADDTKPGNFLPSGCAEYGNPPGPVYLFRSLESTLITAAEITAQHSFRTQDPEKILPEWGSILAERQTKGKGQFNRVWISPPGNIYAALRLPGISPFTELAASPALGGMLADAMNTLNIPVYVKWPNDLILKTDDPLTPYRKIGGILIQERNGCIIAGIGINVSSAPPDAIMRADHAFPAGCLPRDLLGGCKQKSAAELWIALIRHIKTLVDGISGKTNDPMHYKKKDDWESLAESYLLGSGKRVSFAENDDDRHITGILTGLDTSGGLRIVPDMNSSLHVSSPCTASHNTDGAGINARTKYGTERVFINGTLSFLS